MATSAKDVLRRFGRALGSVVVPKTPRGRVRQAAAFVLLLLLYTANLNYAAGWNRSADWLNAQFDKVPQLSGLDIPHYWDKPFRLGLDLQGGTHLVYVADTKGIPEAERDAALSGVRDVIERRVNAFGVSEPLVQTNKSGDEYRVIVDLAGIKDISEAIKLIGETPILEFKEINTAPARELTPAEKKEMDAYNAKAAARANEALRKAKAWNADFGALAQQYSDDAATKDNGGDLGFQSKNGEFGPIVDRIASSSLKPGAVFPELLRIGNKIHIVKLEEKKEIGKEYNAKHILICYADKVGCTSTRSQEEARKLIDELKGKASAFTFAELAKQASEDKGSAQNGGDLGWFGPGEFVKPLEDAVIAMAKGGISEVIETDYGFHLVYKVDERPTNEYRLRQIVVLSKTAEDYLPAAEPWKNSELSGKHLKRATLQFFQQTGEPQVGLEFNDEGDKLFAEITERNVGKPVAIFLDGEVLSQPTVNEPIRDGNAVISGSFSISEAKLLVQRLNAGALPVPITLVSQQTVGASLGQDSLNASLKAGLYGFLAVAVFMLLYYRLPGLIAIIALLLYTSINLALYKIIPVTLTLAGVAGFILSVGMAVDANILIFERLKEELQRGRSLGSAIDEGFHRAWLSIRDSNFTTLISCAILFYTSSSLIKGFALNLGIGVLVSMFSAITVSRMLLKLVGGWKWMQSPSLYLAGFIPAPKETPKQN